jgi:hypothetical protein
MEETTSLGGLVFDGARRARGTKVINPTLPEQRNRMFQPEKASRLLLGTLFAEGGIYLVLLDTRRRVAALTKVLFFGTIAHHAGMENISLPIGVLGSRGLFRHIEHSEWGASFNAASGNSFRTLHATNELGQSR